MRWSIKNTRSWWKNLFITNKKYSYINSIFPSVLASFLVVCIFLKISYFITIPLLIVVCFLNSLNLKFWNLFLFFSVILVISLLIYQFLFKKYDGQEIEGNYELIKKYKNKLIFRYKQFNFQVNIKDNKFNLNENLKTNLLFYVSGKMQKLNEISLFNIRNQIFYNFNYSNLAYIKEIPNSNFIYHSNEIVQDYLNIIVLNRYSYVSSIYKKLSDLNIIHFFTISGFHFSLIYSFLSFIFKKNKIKKPYNELISLMFLLVYLIILGHKISAIRAMLFLLLNFINKNFLKSKFSKISLLAISALTMSLYNPFEFFSYSFILSYIITLLILITYDLCKKLNIYAKNIIVILVAHLSSTLIIHTFSDKYNIFSIFIQVLVAPWISFNFIISILLFKTGFLIEKIILMMDSFLNLLNTSNFYWYFKISNEICILLISWVLIINRIKIFEIFAIPNIKRYSLINS
ncbi:MAG0480 family ComEC-like protein [Mycoplasma enhydrae]|uniref:MAG0480 family ComEC-like protein n=1 Tax=Mycoplasma enhydrae TaxID=2499220 RepID=UPI00384C1219